MPHHCCIVIEWAHCHIARTPSSPHQLMPDMPQAVSDIVMKLLDKLPGDRYHSAEGCAGIWITDKVAPPNLPASPEVRQAFPGTASLPDFLYQKRL